MQKPKRTLPNAFFAGAVSYGYLAGENVEPINTVFIPFPLQRVEQGLA